MANVHWDLLSKPNTAGADPEFSVRGALKRAKLVKYWAAQIANLHFFFTNFAKRLTP